MLQIAHENKYLRIFRELFLFYHEKLCWCTHYTRRFNKNFVTTMFKTLRCLSCNVRELENEAKLCFTFTKTMTDIAVFCVRRTWIRISLCPKFNSEDQDFCNTVNCHLKI